MIVLYIYPHPDDESFGPAHVMYKQIRQGHEVHLLTLTKGGATKQRFKYDKSIDEMGEIRYREMLEVEKVLELTSMTVLDLPDSGLKEMDPRDIEELIEAHILRIQPHVIVTYPVHGISGFHDHLVSHAVVKSVYVNLRESTEFLKRLAFITISEEVAANSPHFHLNGSKPEEIDCAVETEDVDIQKLYDALDCYVTFQETIEKSGIKDFIGKTFHFEFYQEDYNPPIADLFEGLK